MKYTAYWMMASLALCGVLTGCGDSKPVAQEETEVTAPAAIETAAPVEVVEEITIPVAIEEAAPAEVVEEIVVDEPTVVIATVNGRDITEAEVQKIQALFMKQMGGRIPPEEMESAIPRIRERIVEELIMRDIMLAEVAKEGISLSDSEFAEVKTELAEELPDGTTLESYMAETGTTEAEMREQMAVRKMIMAKAESLATPTDEEVQSFYDENKEGFSQGESVSASHILIKTDPKDDEADKAAKRERMEGLRKQLLDGGDFAETAKANSDCPSASAGGDLGSFGRGQMVPEFEDAAFSQPVGSVGEIVETQFGYHLIKVSEHSEAKELDFNAVKERIAETLYSEKQQDAVREFVDGLRSKAVIERFDEVPDEETMLQLDVEDEDLFMDEEGMPLDAEIETMDAGDVEESAPEMMEDMPEVLLEASPESEEGEMEAVVIDAEEIIPAIEVTPRKWWRTCRKWKSKPLRSSRRPRKPSP